jgi:hypothetical protein
MPINNRGILSLTRERDVSVIQSEFRQAMADKSVTELAMHALEFNEVIIAALVELFMHDTREWADVTFINCTGQLEEAAERTCQASQNIQSIGFVRNLERFVDYAFLRRILSSPTMLSLKSFRLSTTLEVADAAHLAEGLANNTNIEAFDLRWTKFEGESVFELARGLALNQSLHTLDFSACGLNDDEVAAIASALCSNSKVKTLTLNSNNCGELASLQLARLLQMESCPIQKLDMSFQQRDFGRRLECRPLVEAIRRNRSLRILDLTCNLLNDDDALMIGEVLTENSSLQELFLARNKFTDIGVERISACLPNMKGLKKLSLWGNQISENGALALLAGMKL